MIKRLQVHPENPSDCGCYSSL